MSNTHTQSLRKRKNDKNQVSSSRKNKQEISEVEKKQISFNVLILALSLAAIIAYTLKKYKILSIEDSASFQTSAFELKELPGRGKGLIANRDIQQGELLIKEKPLILVPSSIQGSPSELLLNRLGRLSTSDKNAFYSLSYVVPGKDLREVSLSEDDMALAIFQTNAIAAGSDVGLFPRTARLNHGCSSSFNSIYSWRPEEGFITVHALKPIKKGEELLTTYTDTKRPRHERQHYLKNYYDFDCSCSVCSLPEPESQLSDKRLTEMTLLGQQFASWGTRHIDGLTASHIANKIWALGEDEGYWSERGRLAADVVHIAASHSDGDAVIKWAEVAHEWFSYELGNDSTQAREMVSIINDPLTHRFWATREKQVLKKPTFA